MCVCVCVCVCVRVRGRAHVYVSVFAIQIIKTLTQRLLLKGNYNSIPVSNIWFRFIRVVIMLYRIYNATVVETCG